MREPPVCLFSGMDRHSLRLLITVQKTLHSSIVGSLPYMRSTFVAGHALPL
ncbi:hypothetical protein Hanom_Chr12g01177501 [Helianthus anomalus]